MKDKIIGVLMGGLSSEREISLKSGKAVAQALREKQYTVQEIIVNQDIATKIVENQIDVAWIALHGEFGEDGCIQGMLEIMGIPYTGSDVLACATSMDKRSTKRALQHLNICQPADQEWDSKEPFIADAPIVIKDPLGGSSIGVWVCRSESELQNAVIECKKRGGRYLLEEYVEGTEITVAVLEGTPLPVVTIIPNGDFFDLKSKYTKGETLYLHPQKGEVISKKSGLPIEIAKQAQQMASLAFKELGMNGVARADFIVPSKGKHPQLTLQKDSTPRFLEINAIPGMTSTSLTPMAAKAVGIEFPDLVERILLIATCKQIDS
jgi:D-alanine-D-alanine ligase